MKSDTMRTFDTGATRDTAADKFDYEGFISPIVLERYASYMHRHRFQSNGTVRDADNWQKGIPIAVYRASLIRHVIAAWTLWRGGSVLPERVGGVLTPVTLEDALMGILFNTMGMMHELLKSEGKQ